MQKAQHTRSTFARNQIVNYPQNVVQLTYEIGS